MLMFLSLFLYQVDLNLEASVPQSWETMARPWMLMEESRLYDSLSDYDKVRFRGTFVARRSEDPQQWSKTGLKLPCFYATKTYGDIRDQIHYALGEPKSKLPLMWFYEDGRRFRFVRQNGTLALSKESQSVWQDLLKNRIRHNLRYDFRTPVFGEVNIPQGLPTEQAKLKGYWLIPTSGETQITLIPQIPEKFREALKTPGHRDPIMRMHLDVMRNGRVAFSRSSSKRIERAQPDSPDFTVALPSGHHQIRVKFWIQNVPLGIEITENIYVSPLGSDSVGTPLLFKQRHPAGIEVPYEAGYFLFDQFYPLEEVALEEAQWVMVHSKTGMPLLLVQYANGSGRVIQSFKGQEDRYLFKVESLSAGDRLIALSPPRESGSIQAISSWPHNANITAPINASLSLKQANTNYLYHEELNVQGHQGDTFLFVQGQPVAMSSNGDFPWDIYDWGEKLEAQVLAFQDGHWSQNTFAMERNQTFEEIAVGHPFLILGMRDTDGKIVKPDVRVFHADGQELPFDTQALPQLKSLTGIMVTPAVTRSIRWPEIRQTLQDWLKEDIESEDSVYIIYATAEPMMVQMPTQEKSIIEASLLGLPVLDPVTQPVTRRRQEALWKTYGRRLGAVVTYADANIDVGSYQSRPKIDVNQGEAEFTPAQFMEDLRHMGRSFGGPHRILVITDQLNTEPQTTPAVLSQLRESGMQFFALELPFATANNRTNNSDALGDNSRDGFQAPMRLMREHPNIQPLDNDPVSGGATGKVSMMRYKWGNKKGKEMNAAMPQIEATYVARFNQQVAARSAGVGVVAQTMPEIKAFFEELNAWKVQLVHLNIPSMTSPEDIRIQAADGGHPFWLVVPWSSQ